MQDISIDESIENELKSIEQKIHWSVVIGDTSVIHVFSDSRILKECPNVLQWIHPTIQMMPYRLGYRHTRVNLNKEEGSLTISWDDDGTFFKNEQILKNKEFARELQKRWN